MEGVNIWFRAAKSSTDEFDPLGPKTFCHETDKLFIYET